MANRFNTAPNLPQFQATSVNELIQIPQIKQQRFDVAQGALNQARIDAGNFAVTQADQQVKQDLIGSLDSDVENIIGKYNGDIGAALNDLTGAISKNRANPVWRALGQNYETFTKYQDTVKQLQAQGKEPLIFNDDVAHQSTLDSQGNVRLLNYDVQGKNDWRKEKEQYFNNVKAELLKEGIRPTRVNGQLVFVDRFGVQIGDEYLRGAVAQYQNNSPQEANFLRSQGYSNSEIEDTLFNEFRNVANEFEYEQSRVTRTKDWMLQEQLRAARKQEEDAKANGFIVSPGSSRADIRATSINDLNDKIAQAGTQGNERQVAELNAYKDRLLDAFNKNPENKKDAELLKTKPQPPSAIPELAGKIDAFTANDLLSYLPAGLESRIRDEGEGSLRNLFYPTASEKGSLNLFVPTEVKLYYDKPEIKQQLLQELGSEQAVQNYVNAEAAKWREYASNLYDWQDKGGFEANAALDEFISTGEIETPRVYEPTIDNGQWTNMQRAIKRIDPKDYDIVTSNTDIDLEDPIAPQNLTFKGLTEPTGTSRNGTMEVFYKYDPDKPAAVIQVTPRTDEGNDAYFNFANMMGLQSVFQESRIINNNFPEGVDIGKDFKLKQSVQYNNGLLNVNGEAESLLNVWSADPQNPEVKKQVMNLAATYGYDPNIPEEWEMLQDRAAKTPYNFTSNKDAVKYVQEVSGSGLWNEIHK